MHGAFFLHPHTFSVSPPPLASFSCSYPPPPLPPSQVREKLKNGEKLPVGSMKIPMVDLPLGATEDRVCGTIDIEKALTEGELGHMEVWLVGGWKSSFRLDIGQALPLRVRASSFVSRRGRGARMIPPSSCGRKYPVRKEGRSALVC